MAGFLFIRSLNSIKKSTFEVTFETNNCLVLYILDYAFHKLNQINNKKVKNYEKKITQKLLPKSITKNKGKIILHFIDFFVFNDCWQF